MGMAFADTLLTETEATLTIVDQQHRPGGHWNVAYPYVRLHQPSAFYGVESTPLGSNTIDATGLNKGLYELASGSEVCTYFDQIMQQRFLPSGRVRYLPMCKQTDGGVVNVLTGESVAAQGKTQVDATYMKVTVPAMRDPLYQIDDGVHCVPPNALPETAAKFERYVVIGGGKTGMDACLFLLSHGVDPRNISWIMPRDSWVYDRAMTQPEALFSDSLGRGIAGQMQAMAEATSLEDLLVRVEAIGFIRRFDESVWPTMWRCATVSPLEFDQLKRIEDVVRLGRVTHISASEIVLEQGAIPTSERVLHIDCTADGLQPRPPVPVFQGDHICLQTVRACQQVFSASLIAHVEGAYGTEEEKNELCTPVPHPSTDVDFLHTSLANALNLGRWSADAKMLQWLIDSRLDGFTVAEQFAEPAAVEAMAELGMKAVMNISKLQAEL